MSPRENLRQEHGNIMRLFSAWQKMLTEYWQREAQSVKLIAQVLDLLEIYVEKCHHGKEELVLFPALGEAHDPDMKQLIAQLRSDHQNGRVLLRELKSQFGGLRNDPKGDSHAFNRQSTGFIELFRKHIRTENAHLLPVIEKHFSGEEQAWMLAQFERFESEDMARQKYKDFEAELKRTAG